MKEKLYKNIIPFVSGLCLAIGIYGINSKDYITGFSIIGICILNIISILIEK